MLNLVQHLTKTKNNQTLKRVQGDTTEEIVKKIRRKFSDLNT